MKSKCFWVVLTVMQDKNERIFKPEKSGTPEPGYYAYAVRCSESDNLKAVLERVGGLVYANVYQTRKRAEEVVKAWNEQYKANGTYLFDCPLF